MGRFNEGNGFRNHLHGVMNKKESKLKVRWWLERLNDELIRKGQQNAPACYDKEDNLDQASQYQDNFAHFLMEIQQEHPDIILEDVHFGEYYGIVK